MARTTTTRFSLYYGGRSADAVTISSAYAGTDGTITLSASVPAGVVVGETITDSGGNTYLITALPGGSDLTCQDFDTTTDPATGAATIQEAYQSAGAWEADLDAAVNTECLKAGDTSMGECRSAVTFAAGVTINSGNSLGLAATKLTALSGEEHDGTAGSGVLFTATIDFRPNVAGTVSLLELSSNAQINSLLNSSLGVIERNIVHGRGSVGSIVIRASNKYVHRNIIYNMVNSGSGSSDIQGIYFNVTAISPGIFVRSNTIHGITRNTSVTAGSYGIYSVDDADENIQYNIVTQVDGSSGGSHDCYSQSAPSNAVMDHNIASDTTASGTGSADSIDPADLYVNTTVGFEDLHLKDGADSNALEIGAGLGTTNGVNIDIDGTDVDDLGLTWDAGAHQKSITSFVPFPHPRGLVGGMLNHSGGAL